MGYVDWDLVHAALSDSGSYLEALASAIDKVVYSGCGAVEYGHGEALALHVENQVLTHDGETNETNISRHLEVRKEKERLTERPTPSQPERPAFSGRTREEATNPCVLTRLVFSMYIENEGHHVDDFMVKKCSVKLKYEGEIVYSAEARGRRAREKRQKREEEEEGVSAQCSHPGTFKKHRFYVFSTPGPSLCSTVPLVMNGTPKRSSSLSTLSISLRNRPHLSGCVVGESQQSPSDQQKESSRAPTQIPGPF
jgi:hypothetical protein